MAYIKDLREAMHLQYRGIQSDVKDTECELAVLLAVAKRFVEIGKLVGHAVEAPAEGRTRDYYKWYINQAADKLNHRNHWYEVYDGGMTAAKGLLEKAREQIQICSKSAADFPGEEVVVRPL